VSFILHRSSHNQAEFPQVNLTLDRIVMNYLEKDRAGRYETVAMGIQRHLRNEPVVREYWRIRTPGIRRG
jgi:hypothetical protein